MSIIRMNNISHTPQSKAIVPRKYRGDTMIEVLVTVLILARYISQKFGDKYEPRPTVPPRNLDSQSCPKRNFHQVTLLQRYAENRITANMEYRSWGGIGLCLAVNLMSAFSQKRT